MPKRTKIFQMIVHFVRPHWATPGVISAESKMLFGPHLNEEREVDIVREGEYDAAWLVR
jgi:hypothetical protein